MALSVETVELDVTNNASVDTAFKVVSAKTGSNRLIGKPLQEVNRFLVFWILTLFADLVIGGLDYAVSPFP